MAVPTNKEELIRSIKINYEKLSKELLLIPTDLTEVKELDGHRKGTLMSINNLIGYLVGWGELVLKWNHRMDNKEAVDFPETGFKWNELGKLAQKFYKDYEEEDFNSLLSKLDDTVGGILSLIEIKTNEELYEVPWYANWTLGRMIQLNTASPYANATGRIRKWKKQKNVKNR
ncbi:ClbS/DfsB family four-helix bundle protein [Sphingobacterium alkalisoli]|uniref:ClbS/DfsB family four-helix bundle protein n=1 Tax=Sphingobacterium alkalisoli TaxID=1874115 RepID=A0A4U0H2Y9_9SPHI|nr:ClbS/DfsB family four-helix bundle protein [Sphingobacterium alkalisoli]TJY65876.1 ClbS/DfsB family four-helix bundle protein [Sphingobacterium alkalisoli]GGH17733.1 hypothetical protein GCM10011418_20900 [Sphingobacterium alkalisoli]